MCRTSLVIMAAGLGSRFGGVKQMEPTGMHGEIIMDYSIHDAIAAGFDKIIIILRRDIEADFRERFGGRIARYCRDNGVELAYAIQDMNDIPAGFSVPQGRQKPWGTCHAVLAAREHLTEPFVVVNADDYYGREAYVRLHDWLLKKHAPTDIAMAGFVLRNTLSEHGGVTRGICKVSDDRSHVLDVAETRGIVKTASGAEVNGESVDCDAYVSMNMWAFPATDDGHPLFVDILQEQFSVFFTKTLPEAPLTAEYLLPTLIGRLLREGKCSVEMLATGDMWFGITYREDIVTVRENFRRLIAEGVYAQELYEN